MDPTDTGVSTPDDSGVIQITKDQLVSIAEGAAHLGGNVGTAHSSVVNFVQNALGKMPVAASAATAAILGTSNAVSAFAQSSGTDLGRVVTINKQIDQLSEIFKRNGTVAGTAATIFNGLKGALEKMGDQSGVAGSLMAKFGGDLTKVIPGILSYMKTIAKAGDEQRVIFAGMVDGARASGAMETVLARVKNGFQDVGKVAEKQMTVWDNVVKSTGLSREEIAKYSGVINKVPGFMENMINSHDGVKRSSEAFTKTIKLMQVSGRDYTEITKDMTSAIMQLGVTENGAADYTTRLTMAANKLHIPFEEVQKAINSSATAFKMFATEGAAADEMSKNMEASMAGYIKMLREAKIPMSNAIEMSQHFAGAISEMSIGQKAFLSQQTGGPGGLMGAFQLDQMMDEGKIDQVFGKMQDSLRKQFGRIVTTKDAATSQSAAEQMTRQIQILRQGPLGKFANTDAEARRLLDAMSNPAGAAEMKKMTTEMTEKKPMEFFLSAGNKIAESTHNILTDILAAVSKTETASISGAAQTTQQLTARNLNRTGTGAGSPDLQAHFRGQQRAHPMAGNPMENLTRDLKNLPEALKLSLSALGKTLSSTEKSADPKAAHENVQKRIAYFKASAAAKTGEQRKADLESAKIVEDTVNKAMQDASTTKDTTAPTVPAPGATTKAPATGRGARVPSPQFPNVRTGPDAEPPGQRLRHAIPGQTQAGRAAPGTAPDKPGDPLAHIRGGGQPVPVTLAPGSSISVNFTGTCPHCGGHVDHTDAAKVNSTAAAAVR